MLLGTLYFNTDVKRAKWSHISKDAKTLFEVVLSASFKKRDIELKKQEILSLCITKLGLDLVAFESWLSQMCSELKSARVQMRCGDIPIVDKATFDEEKIYITVSKEMTPYYIVV